MALEERLAPRHASHVCRTFHGGIFTSTADGNATLGGLSNSASHGAAAGAAAATATTTENKLEEAVAPRASANAHDAVYEPRPHAYTAFSCANVGKLLGEDSSACSKSAHSRVRRSALAAVVAATSSDGARSVAGTSSQPHMKSASRLLAKPNVRRSAITPAACTSRIGMYIGTYVDESKASRRTPAAKPGSSDGGVAIASCSMAA